MLKSCLDSKATYPNFKLESSILEVQLILLESSQICQNQFYNSRINTGGSKLETKHRIVRLSTMQFRKRFSRMCFMRLELVHLLVCHSSTVTNQYKICMLIMQFELRMLHERLKYIDAKVITVIICTKVPQVLCGITWTLMYSCDCCFLVFTSFWAMLVGSQRHI